MTFLSSCFQLVQMARLARTANRGANAPTMQCATIKLESAHAAMAGLGRRAKHVCPSGLLSFSAQNHLAAIFSTNWRAQNMHAPICPGSSSSTFTRCYHCIEMLSVLITVMFGFSFIQYTNTWLSHKAFFITRDIDI